MTHTTIRTTGEAVIDGVLAHGVDTVFGIPGVQTYGLYDAMARSQLKVYGARHEQGAAYMAFGYAQATGRPGVFSVVPGPGVLNAGAALLSGYGASAPMVCLTSEIPTQYMGRGLGHLHEMPDQLATLRTFTKWAANVLHPTSAADLVAEAFHQATSGRPRPAALAIPWDVLTQTGPCTTPSVRPYAPPAPDSAAVEAAAALLAGARNPMIMVGSGAQRASAEVLALAERLQAPVVPFRGGRGIVSSEHPLGFSCGEAIDVWADVDVVVGIGSRMELAWFRWGGQPESQKTVLIDIDPDQHTRLNPTVSLVTDSVLGTAALVAALGAGSVADRTTEYLAARKVQRDRMHDSLQPHTNYLSTIRRSIPRDGIFVEEVSQVGFASFFAYDVYAPRTFITNGHQGSLGFGLCTALGAQAAHPDRVVVSINGDGGFLFGVQELATAVQFKLPVIAIVFDNDAYGNVLNDQRSLFDGRALGSELQNPDFVALAHAFGARGERVDDAASLERAIRDGIEAREPTVIHVPMPLDPTQSPWPWLRGKRRRT